MPWRRQNPRRKTRDAQRMPGSPGNVYWHTFTVGSSLIATNYLALALDLLYYSRKSYTTHVRRNSRQGNFAECVPYPSFDGSRRDSLLGRPPHYTCIHYDEVALSTVHLTEIRSLQKESVHSGSRCDRSAAGGGPFDNFSQQLSRLERLEGCLVFCWWLPRF